MDQTSLTLASRHLILRATEWMRESLTLFGWSEYIPGPSRHVQEEAVCSSSFWMSYITVTLDYPLLEWVQDAA